MSTTEGLPSSISHIVNVCYLYFQSQTFGIAWFLAWNEDGAQIRPRASNAVAPSIDYTNRHQRRAWSNVRMFAFTYTTCALELVCMIDLELLVRLSNYCHALLISRKVLYYLRYKLPRAAIFSKPTRLIEQCLTYSECASTSTLSVSSALPSIQPIIGSGASTARTSARRDLAIQSVSPQIALKSVDLRVFSECWPCMSFQDRPEFVFKYYIHLLFFRMVHK